MISVPTRLVPVLAGCIIAMGAGTKGPAWAAGPPQRSWSLTAELGINISGYLITDEPPENDIGFGLPGFRLAVLVEYDLTPDWRLGAGLAHSGKGATGTASGIDADQTNTYLEVPLQARYVIAINDQVELLPTFGLVPAFWLGGDTTFGDGPAMDNNAMEGFDLGLLVGVAGTYRLTPTVDLIAEILFNQGLITNNTDIEDGLQLNQTLSCMVGASFRL